MKKTYAKRIFIQKIRIQIVYNKLRSKQQWETFSSYLIWKRDQTIYSRKHCFHSCLKTIELLTFPASLTAEWILSKLFAICCGKHVQLLFDTCCYIEMYNKRIKINGSNNNTIQINIGVKITIAKRTFVSKL